MRIFKEDIVLALFFLLLVVTAGIETLNMWRERGCPAKKVPSWNQGGYAFYAGGYQNSRCLSFSNSVYYYIPFVL